MKNAKQNNPLKVTVENSQRVSTQIRVPAGWYLSASHSHVTEVEARLQEARHVRLEEIEIDGVDEDVNRSATCGSERRPMPPVVLSIQQEVCAHDGYTQRHDRQNDEHQQHEAIHVVELVVPERREDEVHLNEDRPKRQHARQSDQHRWAQIPPRLGHLAGELVHTARKTCLGSSMTAQDRAQDSQWARHEEPNEHHLHDRHKRDGVGRAVEHSQRVDEKHRHERDRGEQRRRQAHGADPVLGHARVEELVIEGAARVSVGQRRECVDREPHRHDAARFNVKRQADRDEHQTHRQHQQLRARAHERREQQQVGRRAEDVAVQQLPPGVGVVLEQRGLAVHHELLGVVLGEARVVVLECAQQNERHEAAEEDHHHERVEDGEPVDLVLEELVLEVPVEAVLERDVRLGPDHLVRELELLVGRDGRRPRSSGTSSARPRRRRTAARRRRPASARRASSWACPRRTAGAGPS
ncbi:hypothetical protein ON010_g15363 [Phytophthora cinnamomi]|nr:hypothetical protein ON010_g15363 [Phytophthora cinnamomi]